MIKNPDGSIVITSTETVGIEALIVYANRHVRSKGSYTNDDQTSFVRKWVNLKDGSE